MPNSQDFKIDVSRVQKYSINIGRSKPVDERIRGLSNITQSLKASFSEYALRTSLLHAELHEAIASDDDHQIFQSFTKLNEYTELRLRHDLDNVLEKLCKVLDRSGDPAPKVRACIKIPHRDKDSEDVSIIEYCRSKGVNYGKPCPIEENSAFKETRDTAKPFICKNLMELVYKAINNNEAYRNPRILIDATDPLCKNFKSAYQSRFNGVGPFLSKITEARSDTLISAWHDLWKAKLEKTERGNFQDKNCYASTCVFPITLADTVTSDDFKTTFYKAVEPNHVFAFLCIDHPDPMYFDEVAIDIAGIIADLVVSYYVRIHAYTERSQLWRDCREKYPL